MLRPWRSRRAESVPTHLLMRTIGVFVLFVALLAAVTAVSGCKGKAVGARAGLHPQRLELLATAGKIIRPREGLQLDAHVVYASGDGVTAADRKKDSAAFQWSVTPSGGSVSQSSQVFTATQPGNYTVTVRYIGYSASAQVTVEAAFAGEYHGSIHWSRSFVIAGGSSFDVVPSDVVFTVDGPGKVTGTVRIWGSVHGNAVVESIRGAGTFTGSVSPEGHLTATGSYRLSAQVIAPIKGPTISKTWPIGLSGDFGPADTFRGTVNSSGGGTWDASRFQ